MASVRQGAPLVNSRRIGAYYSAVAPLYNAYAGDARGWHWGIWEPDVRTHQQSLIRSNEVLVRGLDLRTGSRVLDVGCGVGGFAIWAAKTFGCRVTGITICADHVPLARRHARKCGVGHLCEFLRMDMDRLSLRGARFDFVVNQESFCHSLDKRRYLSSIFDVLVPGGAWRCIDTCVAARRQSSAELRRLRNAVYEGFQIPSCPSIDAVERHLAMAGFVEVETVDLTKHVLANRDRMEAAGALPFALASLFPQWCFSGTRTVRQYSGGHYRAGFAFMTALGRGYFKHVLHHARRPVA